jgi:sorbitol-specific phosphotransferase system component IIC
MVIALLIVIYTIHIIFAGKKRASRKQKDKMTIILKIYFVLPIFVFGLTFAAK